MKRRNKILFFTSALAASSIIVAPMAEASTHVVSKGDTLTNIAKLNNTTVNELKKWNRLVDDKIYIGQKIVVANNDLTAAPLTEQEQTKSAEVPAKVEKDQVKPNLATYIVEQGDTLSKIAKKYGVSVNDIQAWNQLTSDKIFVGQILNVNPSGMEDLSKLEKPMDNPSNVRVDLAIQQQLAKENAVKADPTSVGQDIYSDLLELSNSLVGTPYLYGGNTPEGFDCSGFVRYVYSSVGVEIERKSSKDYFLNDTTLVETPVPGDLVFFKDTYIEGISHMGIYLGDGMFVHAGTKGVELSKLEFDYWDQRFVAFKRFNQLL